jgi:hypothetical protein
MVRAAIAVLLAAFLAACAAPARPAGPDAAFVGGSADGALSVALALHDGRATGFTTDGAGVATWFDGTATGGLLDLRAADGAELRGGVHGRIVHGGVVPAGGGDGPDGGGRSFVAVWADEPAGLYRADAVGGGDRIVWIRFADGTSRGVAEIAGTPFPAPDPAADLVVGGIHFGPLVRVAGGAVTGP